MDTRHGARESSGLDWGASGVIAAVVLAWEVLSRIFEIRTDFLPAPSRIALELWRTPQLREDAVATFLEVIQGLLVAVVAAFPAAFLIGCRPRLYRAAAPLFRFLHAAPLLVLAPLLIVWFGFGSLSKILLVVIVCAPSIVAETSTALASIPEDIVDLLRTTQPGWWRSCVTVCLPMNLPGLFRSLSKAISLAVVAVAIGEFVGAYRGFGNLSVEGMAAMRTPRVFAGLAGLAGIAVVLHAALALLQLTLAPVSTYGKRT